MNEYLSKSRRIALTGDDLSLIKGALDVGLPFLPLAKALSVRLGEALEELKDPEHQRLVEAYRAGVNVKDAERELDNDAEVSMGDDDGAYVMVWTWVSNDDAGLPSIYDDGGDGLDGECPSCADKSDQESEYAA